jgi:formylglycine-generating enzyme required for sulfatase activity
MAGDDQQLNREQRSERVSADVFISYKRTDRPKIAALAGALKRMGIEVWFDLSLRTGDRFDDVIEANARACRAMVVCWTNACFAESDSGYVRWEAGIGRERGVLAPIALETPGAIAFDGDWDRLQTEDLSHWLKAAPVKAEDEALDRVGEHGPLSDPAFMRLLDKLGEANLLNRPGLAELSRVYAAFVAAGEPEFTGPRQALETAVKLGRAWLLDHTSDPAAETLARTLVDYEYAALGAQVTQDYGRLLGNWTPPGAESMRRERGLERRLDKLERELGGKDAYIAQLRASLDRLSDAERARDARPGGLWGRKNEAGGDAREALEAVESLQREAERTDIRRPGVVWRDTIKGLAADALPEMVTLPPGRFLMGEANAQHEVRIAHVLALGKYAVTFAQWDAARAAGAKLETPSDRGWGRAQRPVIDVSWQDAQAYLEWLNAELGLSGRTDAYRLPSEAEWEYACRAGTTTDYSFGTTITKSQAQFSEGETGSAKQTAPVGSFPANAFGLYDMHGNVWEWCEDVWHANYQGAPTDGSAWTAGGEQARRVVRGGSWFDQPVLLRSALRSWIYPSYRDFILGFRLARTIITS